MGEKKQVSTLSKIIRGAVLALLFGVIALVAFAVFWTDDEFRHKLLSMPLALLALAYAIYFVMYVIDGIRNVLVFKSLGIRMKFIPSMVSVMYGNLFSYVTPFYLGGQPFQIWYLTQHGAPAADSTNVIVSRFVAYMVVTTLTAFFTWLWFNGLMLSLGLGTFLFAAGFGLTSLSIVVIAAFMLSRKVQGHFIRLVTWKPVAAIFRLLRKDPVALEAGIEASAHQYQASLKSLWHRGNFLFLTVDTFMDLVNVCIHSFALWVCMYWFAGPGAILPNPLETFLLMNLVAAVVGLIPTPGGTGAAEAAYIAVFTSPLITNAASSVAAAVFVWRVATFYLPILIGFVLMAFDRKVLGSAKTGEMGI